jgi:hypothetical protein
MILILGFTMGCLTKAEPQSQRVDITISSLEIIIPVSYEIPVLPIEIPYQRPSYIPVLRAYEIEKTSDIWHAKDPSSYIEVDDPWVLYNADKIRRNEQRDGIIYKTDVEMYPTAPNGDVWQNAGYTLYKLEGDCEDISIAQVSIHRALGHKSIVVAGYLEEKSTSKTIRDFWYEYVDEYGHFTKITSGSAIDIDYTLKPLYMFNDKITWRAYNENWYIYNYN